MREMCSLLIVPRDRRFLRIALILI